MSVLTVLEFPDQRLRTIAKEVTVFDKSIISLADNMLETMYNFKGIGLAATQVDVHLRIIVIDVSKNKDEPMCLVNPEIIEENGHEKSEEGCLSVPGFFEEVSRAEYVKIKAWDKTGKPFELETDNVLAVCIQHEMDHLMGKLFVDYLSPLKRQRIKTKLEKKHRQLGKNK